MGDERLMPEQGPGPQRGSGPAPGRGKGASEAIKAQARGMSFAEGERALAPRENAGLGKRPGAKKHTGRTKEPPATKMVFEEEDELRVEVEGDFSDFQSDTLVALYIEKLKSAVATLQANCSQGIMNFALGMIADLGDESSGLMQAIEAGLDVIVGQVIDKIASVAIGGIGAVISSVVRAAVGDFFASGAKRSTAHAQYNTLRWAAELGTMSTDARMRAEQQLEQMSGDLSALVRAIPDVASRTKVLEGLRVGGAEAAQHVPSATFFQDEVTRAWVTSPRLGARSKPDDGRRNGRIIARVATTEDDGRFSFEVEGVSLAVASQPRNAAVLVMEAIGHSSLWECGIPVDLVFERPLVAGGWTHSRVDLAGRAQLARRPVMFDGERACWEALKADKGTWSRIESLAGDQMGVE